ncbi:hypothetical protein [Nostoc sp. FACHB-190]|uniref:hypothetical protein n=1 Tax=Nostoc sp. FACHB-190 TaxID=2692838 RepID=UPI001682A060|nr:hypothetical protein [Nostoc sp. FACHB-190]MBD2303485.1 hypothetical protein [Nostoc sp. FACHB-190]
MRVQRISPETEILLVQIAEKHYPRTRFKAIEQLQFTVDRWVEIDFIAYLSESAATAEDKPFSNPFHNYYRRDRFDFNVSFSLVDNFLLVSGNWHDVILTLKYRPSGYSWLDESENVPRPSPHGDKLEAIAQEMHPLLIK